MDAKSLATKYARMLLDLAQKESSIDQVERDLELISETLDQHLKLKDLLRNPQVDEDIKRKIVDEIFGDQVAGVSCIFLKMMVDLEEIGRLHEVTQRFARLAEESEQRVVAEVTSAVPLTEELSEKLRKKLVASTGKNVQLRHRLDDSVLGGLIVRINGRVVDASLGRQLALLREKLATREARSE